MPRRSLALAVVLVAAGSVLAGCGGGSSSAKGRPLEGTPWILDQHASRLTFVVPSVVVTAQFSTDGRVSGNSGCNQYGAGYRVKGASITIEAPIGTMMACEASAMRVEQAYLARLPKATTFAVQGDTLTIRTSGEGPLVYEAVNPDTALAGDWVVVSYYRADAVVSPVVGSNLTATFDAGRISGDSGCNQYSGPYEVDGTKITIGPLASTLRACADPEIDQQASDYLAALDLARTFSLDRGNLTLLRADGGIAVTYQRG